jgi:hypothetical protein
MSASPVVWTYKHTPNNLSLAIFTARNGEHIIDISLLVGLLE